ncbi:MAG: LacI family DNA-binding transcriptional regulator [Pedococcus sp.]
MAKAISGTVGLREVAQRAGVSAKTVSNVVNDYVHVSPATRDKVQRAIEELHYRPNLTARSLRSGRSGLIALAVPEIDFPYFAELANHVVRAAEVLGWTVLIDQTDGQAAREELVLGGIRNHLIDGVIFSPLASGRSALRDRTDTVPMVLLGERISGGSTDHVGIDNVGAAQAAVLHLAALGRTRIAAIGIQRKRGTGTSQLRAKGYRSGLRAAGLALDESLVMMADSYHRADGHEAMLRLLDRPDPPDAVFCFNDLLALGALHALRERGLDVPGDVAVVGFDDIEECSYSSPTLTTIAPDKARIAQLAVELLARRMTQEGAEPPTDAKAPYELVVRESTGGPGRVV